MDFETDEDCCSKKYNCFQDYDKCLIIIDSLHRICQNALNKKVDDGELVSQCEQLSESFKRVISLYQEQPELLDSSIPLFIHRLTSPLSYPQKLGVVHYKTIFKFLYQFIKLTGFKSIGKKFPNEASKLPLVVALLSKEDPQDRSSWEIRLVLIAWLSTAILAPFDLSKFDDSEHPGTSLSSIIYDTLMKNLKNFDSCQVAAAYCLAKFFSRPDILRHRNYLNDFIVKATNELYNVKLGKAASHDDIVLLGYLRALCYMFKLMPHDELRLLAPELLGRLISLDVDAIDRELVNHLVVKLLQRCALVLLPKRVASWHYKRSSRVLGKPLTKDEKSSSDTLLPARDLGRINSSISAGESNAVDDDKTENEFEYPENLLGILNALFSAAQNGASKIRLSAAKGIARLASRMSRERVSHVIDLLVEYSFGKSSNDCAWHGGCLALAEMSRGGVILEEKLPIVIDVVKQAIIHDKLKAGLAIAPHVREAACYICWAMARTYEDHILAPYVDTISDNLLCTMLFDRELQCRRAASATFQELVGRQGTFNAQTIDLIGKLDYQAVGQRQFTYLQLAPQVAALPIMTTTADVLSELKESSESKIQPTPDHYARVFVQHLVEKKCGHSDAQIRSLASDSLAALMLHLQNDTRDEYVENDVLPKLLLLIEQPHTQTPDANIKHGGVLAFAKLIRSLATLQFNYSTDIVALISLMRDKCAKQLATKLLANMFSEALCHLIVGAEAARLPVQPETIKTVPPGSLPLTVIDKWTGLAMSALDSDKAELREVGAEAVLSLYRTLFDSNKTRQDTVLSNLHQNLTSPNESTRCGCITALSKLALSLSDSSCTTDANVINNGHQRAQPKLGDKPVAEKIEGSTTLAALFRVDADTSDVILISLASYIGKPSREPRLGKVFAESRACACEGFVNFVRALSTQRIIVSSQSIRLGFDALLAASEDCVNDKRGDIGVRVRRAAIEALCALTMHLLSLGRVNLLRELVPVASATSCDGEPPGLVPRLTKVIVRTLQQAVSYHDRTRMVAGECFYKLINCICSVDKMMAGRGGEHGAAGTDAMSLSIHDQSTTTTSILADGNRAAAANATSANESINIDHAASLTTDGIAMLVPHLDHIHELFRGHKLVDDDSIAWRLESLPALMSLLAYPVYRADLWLAIMPGVGQVSDLCAQPFKDALCSSLTGQPASNQQDQQQHQQDSSNSSQPGAQVSQISAPLSLEQRAEAFRSLVDLVAARQHVLIRDVSKLPSAQSDKPMDVNVRTVRAYNERLMTHALIMIEHLINQSVLASVVFECKPEYARNVSSKLIEFIWQACTCAPLCDDSKRVQAAVRCMCGMLQFCAHTATGSFDLDTCVSHCRAMLCMPEGLHKHATEMRRLAAQQIYLCVMMYQDELEAAAEKHQPLSALMEDACTQAEHEDSPPLLHPDPLDPGCEVPRGC